MVFFELSIDTSTFTHSTASGEMRIGGFPFNFGTNNHAFTPITRFWTAPANVSTPTFWGKSGGSYIRGFSTTNDGTTYVTTSITEWTSGTNIAFILSGSYST
jgi:hypothetical protein